jgi:hypothetical protein
MTNTIKSAALLILALVVPGYASAGSGLVLNDVVHVWASMGPLAYLSHSQVRIRNSDGKIVGRGLTNDRGTVSIRLKKHEESYNRLTIEAQGGRVMGKPFRGRLLAKKIDMDIASGVVYLDIITTTASLLEREGFEYGHSIESVRRTLGIHSGMPADIIRVKNAYVDLSRLQEQIKRNGGLGRVLKKIRDSVKSGERYGELTPKPILFPSVDRTIIGGDNQPAIAYPQSTTSTVCTDDSSTPNSNPSNSLIEDIGAAAMKDLGRYVKVPNTASDIVVGKVFGIKDDSMTGLENAIKEVQKQLDCISKKIDYLSTQVQVLQLDVNLQGAKDCKAAIDPAWSTYNYAINSYPASDASQATKDEYKRSLDTAWMPQWKNLALNTSVCGAKINNSLFDKVSLSPSSWNIYYSSYAEKKGGLLYPADVQSMQAFLATWSNLTYEYFVMTNEYYDYDSLPSAADASAGYKTSDTTYCSDSTLSSSSNFCVWANNISKAYPASIYSDEIAISRTGMGINAVPGIAEKGSPYSYCIYKTCYGSPIPMRLLTAYEIAAYPTKASWGSQFSASHLSSFNSKPLNTSSENSAVETYEQPRAYRSLYVKNSDITELSPYQAELRDFFFGALTNTTYVPNSVWSGLTSSQVSFGGVDSIANINKSKMNQPDFWEVTINPNAQINNFKSKSYCMYGYDASGMTLGIPCNDTLSTPPHPTLGILLGRTWWPESAQAATFQVPDPRCYMTPVPSGLTCQ